MKKILALLLLSPLLVGDEDIFLECDVSFKRDKYGVDTNLTNQTAFIEISGKAFLQKGESNAYNLGKIFFRDIIVQDELYLRCNITSSEIQCTQSLKDESKKDNYTLEINSSMDISRITGFMKYNFRKFWSQSGRNNVIEINSVGQCNKINDRKF
jgi:hypothetical protein